MPKYLVASGCSFTHEKPDDTWVTHLSKDFKLKKYNYARSSMGNGLIARTTAYGVSKLLSEGIPAEEILVGVMWSGFTRVDFYSEENPKLNYEEDSIFKNHNPVKFVEAPGAGWVIGGNGNWTSPIIQNYFLNFWSAEGQSINTLEKVLWLQDFLERRNIKYFFSSYLKTWKGNTSPNTTWMSDQIDWSVLLPSEFDWLYERFGRSDYFRASDMERYNDPFKWDAWHPSAKGHRIYTDEVIMPYLRKKYDIF